MLFSINRALVAVIESVILLCMCVTCKFPIKHIITYYNLQLMLKNNSTYLFFDYTVLFQTIFSFCNFVETFYDFLIRYLVQRNNIEASDFLSNNYLM